MTEVEFEALKLAQWGKALDTIAMLADAETCAGASLILGIARGRIEVMLDMGLVRRAEYVELRESFKAQVEARWPYLSANLSVDLPPGVH